MIYQQKLPLLFLATTKYKTFKTTLIQKGGAPRKVPLLF